VIGLGELATDLTDLAKRLRGLIALLADPKRCAFVAVARPAELPRLETARLVEGLEILGVPLCAIVANAVTEGECSRCAAAAEAEKPELGKLRRLGPTIVAPAFFPAPAGAGRLRAWRATWRR
jgi:anion-transporting  ArsA/GET3 family ATPase